MKNPKARIIAQNGNQGLDIFLDISGSRRYLTTRRPNGLLYLWLRDGKSIGEISRMKPQYSRTMQKTYHYAQYLIRLVENYFRYELAA